MNKIKSNFEGQNIYVGMDIHKASWNLGRGVIKYTMPGLQQGSFKKH